MRERTHRRRTPGRFPRRTVAAVAAGAVGLGLVGGGTAWALGRADASDRYRTATAELGTVAQLVQAVGTVSSVTRRDAAFATAGTVATVDVAVGDGVTAGQRLATLDATELQTALDEARSALADAQQQLEDDLETQASSSSSSSSSSTASPASATASGVVRTASTRSTSAVVATVAAPSPTAVPSGEPSSAVERAAADVTAAQAALQAAYDALAQAVADQTDAWTGGTCTAFLAIDPSTVVPDDPDADGPSDDPDAGPSGDAAGGTATETAAATRTGLPVSRVQQMLVACQEALTAAGGALADPLATLSAAADDLDTAVDALLAAVAEQGGTGPGTDDPGTDPAVPGGAAGGEQGSGAGAPAAGGSAPSGSAPSGATSSGPVTGGGPTSSGDGPAQTRTVTAATILADRARIALREADVAVAEHELTLVDLTSPVAGTVAAVGLAVGDRVEASSTTSVVTVLGDDGHVVTLSVPLTSIDAVAVGQTADVRVATTDADLTGTVSSIGVLDVSETSTPAYTVLVALEPTDEPVVDDSSAHVEIAVAAAEGVLTVPTSAVRTTAGEAAVRLLGTDGTVTDAAVETGAVGSELTEVRDGLEVGDVVVLADLEAPLELGDEDAATGLSGLSSGTSSPPAPGGRPGGGGPPGGITGGIPPRG